MGLKDIYNKPKKKRTLSDRFQRARWQAKNKGKVWLLSKEEWLGLIKDPCHYCGVDTSDIVRGSGLDRINNNLGYELGNVVSCCYECNLLKGGILTYEEAKVVISALKSFRSQK